MDDIVDFLCGAVAKDILKDRNLALTAKEPLISSGLLDSFNLVDLAMLIEDKYQVRIEDYELNAELFDTVEELAETILRRRS